MAKIKPLPHPTYYAYYDLDSGNLLAFSNEQQSSYDNMIVVSYELYDMFVSGREQFKDWVVTRTKNPDSQSGMEIVPRFKEELFFKNNMFEWVNKDLTDTTELAVYWSQFEKQWIFLMQESAQKRFYKQKFTTSFISFYITLETDFNRIIRTIDIDIAELAYKKVCIPFEFDIEHDIDKISISTKSIFDSYGLSVWKDNNE
jgi:hypothetical protein